MPVPLSSMYDCLPVTLNEALWDLLLAGALQLVTTLPPARYTVIRCAWQLTLSVMGNSGEHKFLCDVNQPNKDGMTPLMFAIKLGQEEVRSVR